MTERRRAVLEAAGARGPVVDELLAYNENVFARPSDAPPLRLPLPDEPHVEVWREYGGRADKEGAAAVLRAALVQLSFPVAEGMSGTEEYAAATRKGVTPGLLPSATGLPLEDPAGISIAIHEGPAGAIPVIQCPGRRDFETLVQALTRRNEAWPVPPSMGACMVAGLVNWDRVRRHREAFLAEDPDGDWNVRLTELSRRPELIRDRFILLSRGPYSGVAAANLGLDDDAWLERSTLLRAEHEATHYFTRRVYGAMRNNALDEVIADYMGNVAAFGHFRVDAGLHFFGLEDPDAYRDGGRLQNYREPPLSEEAFAVLCTLTRLALANLQVFDDGLSPDERQPRKRARTLVALTAQTLEGLADTDAPALLQAARAGAELVDQPLQTS